MKYDSGQRGSSFNPREVFSRLLITLKEICQKKKKQTMREGDEEVLPQYLRPLKPVSYHYRKTLYDEKSIFCFLVTPERVSALKPSCESLSLSSMTQKARLEIEKSSKEIDPRGTRPFSVLLVASSQPWALLLRNTAILKKSEEERLQRTADWEGDEY